MYKNNDDLYYTYMTTLPISEARAELAHAIAQAESEPVTISRHGEAVAVLISPSLYEQLMESAEELTDIADFDAAATSKDPQIPWDVVKKDLGLH